MNFKIANSLDLETFWFLSSFIFKSIGELGCTADSCLVFCSVPSCSVYQSAEYLEGAALNPGCLSPKVLSRSRQVTLGQKLPAVQGCPGPWRGCSPQWEFIGLSGSNSYHK